MVGEGEALPDLGERCAAPRIRRERVAEADAAGETAAGRLAFPDVETVGLHEALVVGGGLAVAVAVIRAVLWSVLVLMIARCAFTQITYNDDGVGKAVAQAVDEVEALGSALAQVGIIVDAGVEDEAELNIKDLVGDDEGRGSSGGGSHGSSSSSSSSGGGTEEGEGVDEEHLG